MAGKGGPPGNQYAKGHNGKGTGRKTARVEKDFYRWLETIPDMDISIEKYLEIQEKIKKGLITKEDKLTGKQVILFRFLSSETCFNKIMDKLAPTKIQADVKLPHIAEVEQQHKELMKLISENSKNNE